MNNTKRFFLITLVFLFTAVFLTSCGGMMTKGQQDSTAALNQNVGVKKGVVTFNVIGKGISPLTAKSKAEAKLLGESAARADAYLKLVERIHGVYIDSYRRVGNGVVNYEKMNIETRAWLKGAEILDIQEVEDGIFEAYVRLRLEVKEGHPFFHLAEAANRS